MHKDRGTIKWTSLMLPEHVRMLKSLWHEEDVMPPPTLDSQEEDRLNHLLIEAAAAKAVIHMTLYMDHKHVQKTGTLVSLDQTSGHFVFYSTEGERRSIPIQAIVNLELDNLI